MVNQVRLTEKAVGNFDYQVTEKMKAGKQFARSVYFSKDLKAGDIITSHDIRSVRPGYSLHLKNIYQVLGKKQTLGLGVELRDRVNLNVIK